jgi:ESCRT-II complex subunit VPS22
MSNQRGLQSLSTRELAEKFQNLGLSISNSQQEQLQTQLQVFQAALISFKEDYKDEIRHNENIRSVFSEICIAFGIDPLVVASTLGDDEKSKYERRNQLCLKIIEWCMRTRPLNGGIIALDDLVRLINSDTWVNTDLHLVFTESDIMDAINHLSVLGKELEHVKIGKREYIKSISQELNPDQRAILDTADVLGYVSVSLLHDNFGWKRVRCRTSIDELVTNGILWVDIREKRETKYWITSWVNQHPQ